MDIDDIVYKYSVIKNICVILHGMKRLNQDMGLFTWQRQLIIHLGVQRGVWGLKIKEKYLYRIGMNIRNVLLSTLLLYII